MGDSESHLLDQCAAGDAMALELLYRRYVDRVWRYGWFWTHSREAAAEIVQDTFLRVLRSIKSFKRRSSFSTWLFAITRSVVIERSRRDRRDRGDCPNPSRLRLVSDTPPPPSMDGEETRDAVRRAVCGLPAAQRDAVVLCELSGLRVREAAEVLGWSESRVKVTLFRARRRLRDSLERALAV